MPNTLHHTPTSVGAGDRTTENFTVIVATDWPWMQSPSAYGRCSPTGKRYENGAASEVDGREGVMTIREAIASGGSALLHRRWLLGLAGALWLMLGISLFMNAILGSARMSPTALAAPLFLDALLTLAAILLRRGVDRIWLAIKGGVFLLIATVTLATDGRAETVIGVLVGTFLTVHATWCSVKAWLVRFEGWRRAVAFALVELAIGVWSLLFHPVEEVVGSDISLLIMNSGFSLLAFAAWAGRRGRANQSP